MITIKFEQEKLFIIGDQKEEQNIKIIELSSKWANEFISEECQGNVDNIFKLLKYDSQSGDLFLVANGAEDDANEEARII
jgi:hypothetical protein